MKIKEIILEYKRDITASKLGEKLYAKLLTEPKDWQQRGVGFDVNNIDKNKVIDVILEKIEAADPTNNKQYVTWIIRTYLNTDIHLEDAITKPTGALAKFYKLTRAKKIQPPYNDINRIKDINDLEDVVSQFSDEEKQLVDKGNYQELYRDGNVRVIVPLDKTAACYYGQGTKWCTAASQNNFFNEYTRNGAKLYIILPQNPTYPGEKYQLSFEYDQFMNELDEPIDIMDLFNEYPSLKNALKPELDNSMYEFMLYENPSENMLIRAVNEDASMIYYIKNPSEAVQVATVQKDAIMIRKIKNPCGEAQIAAFEEDEDLLVYFENIEPELVRRYPILKKLLIRLQSDEVLNNVIEQFNDLLMDYLYDMIDEMEMNDDYFNEWQSEQARELGYVDENGDVDWDKVHEDDNINNYLDYNYEAKKFSRGMKEFCDSISPEVIRTWSKDFSVDDDGDINVGLLYMRNLDDIYIAMLKEDNFHDVGDYVKNNIRVYESNGEWKVKLLK